MMGGSLSILAVALQAVSTSNVPPAEILKPSGKWTIEVADAACVLSRDYGGDASGVALALRRRPLSPGYDIILFRPDTGRLGPSAGTGRNGATIGIGREGRTIRADFETRITNTAPKRHVTTMPLTAADFADLTNAAEISISDGPGSAIPLAIAGGAKATTALKSCSDDLLREWGVDPAEADRVATPAVAKPSEWLSDSDYPAAAKGAEGKVSVVFVVDTEGRVTDCRPVGSSGSPVLDETTCRLIAKRVRYMPAIGTDGAPIAVHKSISFTWRR